LIASSISASYFLIVSSISASVGGFSSTSGFKKFGNPENLISGSSDPLALVSTEAFTFISFSNFLSAFSLAFLNVSSFAF